MQAFRAALLAAMALDLASGASVKALLIDGQETQGKTATIKSILEAADVLHVDVLTAPAKGAAFDPPFDRYKVVILNYSSDGWPMSTLANLDKYLQNGGGMVALVASDAAFPMSEEYNTMLGISSASNRDQNAGPVWFFQDNNIAFDKEAKGPAGKAPKMAQPFTVTIRNTEQPITKGLPLEWMHASDTLLGNLRGPGKGMIVLATAHSDAEHGGTGHEEPVLITVPYGKGRVFHTLLGSTSDGIACVGFQTTLQRGAEWAATNKVNGRIPSDFPHEDKPSTRAVK